MLSIIDVERLGYPTVEVSGVRGEVSGGGALGAGDGQPSTIDHPPSAAMYRTSPQLDGNLRVDPEIHLPSPGLDVDVASPVELTPGRHQLTITGRFEPK